MIGPIVTPTNVVSESDSSSLFGYLGGMKSSLIAVAFACMMAGCAAQPPPRPTVPFDEAEFKRYEGFGNSTIVGQAFKKTRGGDVKFAAGEIILFLPGTPYTIATYDMQVSRMNLADADPKELKYVRKTYADGSGNFAMMNLDAGEYFVYCAIFWEVGDGNTTGGVVCRRVHVGAGQTAKCILTDWAM